MALTDHKPEPRKHTGHDCSVNILLEQLDNKDRAELQSWLDDSNFTSEAIWHAIRAAGLHAGRQTVARHRAQTCRCFR